MVLQDYNMVVVEGIPNGLEVSVAEVFDINMIDLCPELRMWAIEGANFECLDCHCG